MSNRITEEECLSQKTLDKSIISDLRCLPSLPRTASSVVIPSHACKPDPQDTNKHKWNTDDDVDSLSQELRRCSNPGTTSKQDKQCKAQTAQLSRILKHFETNLSFFHQREKRVQVEVLVGLEKTLDKFSKNLRGTFLKNRLSRIENSNSSDRGKRMVEWPVCGKYPNCVICSMEIRELNKENVIRSMKTEATELEKQALLERREREIKILEEDVSFLKQENHKKEKELLTKIGELNRKSYEADQWKAEANNAEKQRKRIEASYLNLQAQTRTLQGSDSKLSGLQSKYSTLERENKQLMDKVKNLEKTEKEFKQLEYNISVLQNHLQDMESVEKERDDLLRKLKIVEDQRDDLLKKGRMVESERNDFLRNNKIMEMQRDELEQRYAMAHKNQMELKAAADEMEDKIQDANNKTLDAQHERNFVQAKYNKLEDEKNELEKRVAGIIQERNSLETRLAELEDRSRLSPSRSTPSSDSPPQDKEERVKRSSSFLGRLKRNKRPK